MAVVAGTKSEDVVAVLKRIDEEVRCSVEEVSLDLSDSMRKIVKTAFPKASRVIDRFHVQKLACDAVQELRIKHRWDAIQQANDEKEEAKLKGADYEPYRFPTGDTRKELLCYSNRQTNGLKNRNKGLKYCLKNIRTSNRHIHCVILCG